MIEEEPKATPEMIEAAVFVLATRMADPGAPINFLRSVAEEIYEAMQVARQKAPKLIG